MEMNLKTFALAAPVAAAFMLLSGCSGEPSSGEVKELVTSELKPVLEQQAAMMKSIGGLFGGSAKAMAAPVLEDVKKAGCKEDGKAAFKCDVEVTMASGDKRDMKVMPIRFVKTSAGWQMSQ
ncbi:hypothetical protein [Piscinibacter sakaiensis]|uniref:hypothetical protein n=1 Tax=Piscinibacter sakaiensis TaxID=1547922 RepID=UPI003AACD1CC